MSGAVIWRVAQETVVDPAPRTVDGQVSPDRHERRSGSAETTTSEPDVVASASAEMAEDSPTRRRNKRKMTEPRRRATDFSIRSICSSNSDVERGDDDDSDNASTAPVDAKIWKPACSMYDATPPTTHAFSFYPLNIPMIHALHRGSIGGVSAPLAATPTPARPPSSESSLGSSGEHDRSAQADDTSSSGGRPPSSGTRAPTTDASRRLAIQSPPSVAPVAADRQQCYGGRASSPRKNYKNMTKQRRIEANARERTRVHTISAAFESLRRAVPSYSYNQRLSKLAILRIACSYILALARLADLDYSSASAGDRSDKQMSFADCVDLCTQTIQSEGRAKRRH